MTGSVLQRAIKLHQLLSIKVGPAAVSLPANITGIHLAISKKKSPRSNSINRTAKKFWRKFLPQLKYHNPHIPMTVDRQVEPSCSSELTIYFNDSRGTVATLNDSKTASKQIFTESISDKRATSIKTSKKVINMNAKTSEIVLDEFVQATKARATQPSEKDLQLTQWLERASENSLIEANKMKTHNEKRKRQEEMMSAAKGVMI
ncbi:50S ribosomal protein Mrp49 [Golovinomyces cichoracearum]|uniref:50S ribosomal protein Mrp49 n=1 Tax=Golovinomyces cichoracearum TaxID=62708 RepID=A0A420JB13_9PEZI|nr:50S ribosomal protein Mrp49 [Golovinomyces cichoracearum]